MKTIKDLFLFIFLINIFFNFFAIDFIDKHKAFRAFSTGNYDKAKNVYEKLILKDDPKNPDPDLMFNLANVFYEKKKFDIAANYFEKVVSNKNIDDKKKEEAYFNLANSLAQLKNLQGALDRYKKVVELNQNNIRAKKNIEIIEKILKQQEQENQKQDKKNKDQKQNGNSENKNSQEKSENLDNRQDGDKNSDSNKSDKKQDGNRNEQDNRDDGFGNERNKQDWQQNGQEGDTEDEINDSAGQGKNIPEQDKDCKKNQKHKNNNDIQHDESYENNEKLKQQKENISENNNCENENGKEQDVGQLDKDLNENWEKKLDEQNKYLLSLINENDKNLNKNLVKAKVFRNNKENNHGKKNW